VVEVGIPVIDLRDDPHTIALQIGEACEHVGFFQIIGHSVPDHVIDDAWVMTRAFFDQPEAVRNGVAMPTAGYPYGYQGFAAETLASSIGDVTPPDRKHTYSLGPLDTPTTAPTDPDEIWVRSPNLWPVAPVAFREAMETYYIEMSCLAARLLGHMAAALGLGRDYFVPMIDEHVSALRCLDYPQLPTVALPGQLRAGAHTDYGTLTILRTAVGSTGLEVRSANRRWIPVDAVAAGFVINLGDSLAQWTNNHWRSTMHRVVEQPEAARRTSIAFFHNANWDALIECLPGRGEPHHPPVLAGRHLMDKFQRTVVG
jgi:isopenicillin N synthase-like dioxygenase